MSVTVQLMGGIGNRLFQVAAAYGYAKHHGKSFTLVKECIEENRYTIEDHQKTIFRQCPTISRLSYKTINEPSDKCFSYIDLPSHEGNVRLFGYFQNENYFKDYRQEILDLFRMEPERCEKLKIKYPDLDNALFIHIRTYVIKQINGTLESAHDQHKFDYTQYIQRALKYISDKINPKTIYLLTDNLDLCITMYGHLIPNHKFIDENELDSLYLMSLCGYGGICSNSSFSWWGSYLNESSKKIVIMPDSWLKQPWPCSIQPSDAVVISLN